MPPTLGCGRMCRDGTDTGGSHKLVERRSRIEGKGDSRKKEESRKKEMEKKVTRGF